MENFFFTRIELDDMHSKQCTQKCFGSTVKATSGGFSVLQQPLPWQRGIQPGFRSTPISRCITFFSFEICSVRACQGFIPVETKRAEEPQTVRPGTCERVGLECRKGEDGEKRRAERPGSDTRRDKTPFKRVMELSDWRLWAETVDRLATEIGGASEIRQG